MPFPFTLTARAESFIRGNPDLDDVIRRLQAFEAAGADVLMAPGLPDLAAVRTVCSALSKPFNFMAGIKGKSFSVPELAEAGVKRISLATSLYRAAMTGLLDAAREVKEKGTLGYVDTSDADAGAERLHAGLGCHCEQRGDEAIPIAVGRTLCATGLDCRVASLLTRNRGFGPVVMAGLVWGIDCQVYFAWSEVLL